MVPGKTLATALDFVNLLWSDRVEEDLIEDINPLNEVEAHFQASNGFETAYLKFSFKRVSIGADVAHILVSVTDITESVRLRLELQQAQAASEAQLDLLMSILHVAPDQLHAFLNDSESSLRQANAILMEPAGSDEQFKDKIAQLFRAVHGVKSDAAGLGLPTIEAKAHGFEDELQQLRSLAPSSLVATCSTCPSSFDHLLSHFGSIRSLVSRLTALRSAFEAPGQAVVAESRAVRPVPVPTVQMPTVPPVSGPTREDDDIEQTQRLPGQDVIEQAAVTLAERIGSELGKRVRVTTSGLQALPDFYRTPVKDIILQLVRNALVHGIETPEERAAAGKGAIGTVSIEVRTEADQFFIAVEDDGRGLSTNRILAGSDPQGHRDDGGSKAPQRNERAVADLQARFSTANEITEHAGRGVGMDIVKTRVKELGGRIGIGAERGRRTAFRIALPLRTATWVLLPINEDRHERQSARECTRRPPLPAHDPR